MQREAPHGTPDGETDGERLWRLDRIDFVADPEGRCAFCNHPMKTRVARWLVAEDGEERASGPDCARRNAPTVPKALLPDFTRASFDFPEEDAGPPPAQLAYEPGRGAGGARRPHGGATDGSRELEYLRLRVEKLGDLPSAATPRLKAIHRRTMGTSGARVGEWGRSATLSEADLRYLRNLIAFAERERPRLSPASLQSVYAYRFWLARFLRTEPHPFVVRAQAYLKSNLSLTPGQIEAVNKFFANRKGFPRLDPSAFARGE